MISIGVKMAASTSADPRSSRRKDCPCRKKLWRSDLADAVIGIAERHHNSRRLQAPQPGPFGGKDRFARAQEEGEKKTCQRQKRKHLIAFPPQSAGSGI